MRQLYNAKLLQKLCLSEPAQCFHLEFRVEDAPSFDFIAGQFVSLVAEDATGKTQTRAYSIASAPWQNHFDLCVNRIQGGLFSNLLADLPHGQTLRLHGPHGHFVLREPLTDSLLIATGTGIAPMRGFCQALFPESGEDRSGGHEVWLVYGTRHETELYYRRYFEKLATKHRNFHYISTLSRPHSDWQGSRGYVQDFVEKIAREYAPQGQRAWSLDFPGPTIAEVPEPSIHAYICGLNQMVSATRETLTTLGWQRKQIIFERYD